MPTHVPVLLERCLELLDPALVAPGQAGRDAVHLDATVGLGGHAEAVLAAYPRLILIGLDRDPAALAVARDRLAGYGKRVHLVQAVYTELADILARMGIEAIDGALFDLGVSSMQLDDPQRGFAYARDAALDMRMDQSQPLTAQDVVNTYDAAALIRILRAYGQEKFAPRIAASIVRERARHPITSTAHLAELVRQSIPAPARRTGGHPAKRTFQALRIEVNGELAALQTAMPAVLDRLALGGRVVIMSYQSLEDRIVKQALGEQARSQAPVDLPVEPAGFEPTLRLLTKGAELAGPAELAANPRAASVRLRAAQRIAPPGQPGRGMYQPGTATRPARTRIGEPGRASRGTTQRRGTDDSQHGRDHPARP